MFAAWGHRAHADLNARGNIDVAFAIDRNRFVLEAKWEQDPVGIGPITKLQKRVKQRLGGTIGVLVSMSGYTQEALRDLKDGERLEVVLLSKEHVEAMLAGLVPPHELFELLLDVAHFYGDPTRSLSDLLIRQQPELESVVGLSEDGPLPSAEREAVSGTSVEWVARNLPFGQSGLSVFPDGKLLVVTGEGLTSIDPDTQVIQALASPSQVTAAKVVSADAIAIVRRFGVAVLCNNGVTVLGGPFGGRVTFVAADRQDDRLMVFSNMAHHTKESGSMLVSLGAALGEQAVRRLALPGGAGAGAICLGKDSFLIFGNPSLLIGSSGTPTEISIPLTNPHSGVPLANSRRVLIGGGDVELVELDLDSRASRGLASINLRGSVVHVASDVRGDNRFYVSANYESAHYSYGTEYRGAVVMVQVESDRHGTS
jgi:hypothetical protein